MSRVKESHEIVNTFSVPFSYRVIFSDGLLEVGNNLLAGVLAGQGEGIVRALVMVDAGLASAQSDQVGQIERYFHAHRGKIRLAGPVLILPGGESAKQDDVAYLAAVNAIAQSHLDRHSFVVAIGGGAMLDVAGFAASTAHRGVRLIRVPTTVLAQNDAGIGVKNGINFAGQKNYLGNFAVPVAVLNDYSLLKTLPAEHWRGGLSEAVKVALIRDGAFYQWIEETAEDLACFEAGAMRLMIRRCAELHMEHIRTSGDPFEFGTNRPLDFGHWSAHRLEQLSGGKIGHGQAVAVGIAIDALYSASVGLLEQSQADRIINCLKKLGFELAIGSRAGLQSAADMPRLLQGIADFHEHLGGRLTLAMLGEIGKGVDVTSVNLKLMAECCGRVLLV